MFEKLILLFAAASTLLYAGCTVTSSIAPPFVEQTSLSPQEFCGNWVCHTDSDTYNIAISQLKDSKNAVLIRIIQNPKNKQKDFNEKWAPLCGFFSKIRGRIFLTATVHIAQVLQDAKYNDSAFWMLTPRFYLLQLSPTDSGFDLQFITFAEFSNKQWKPSGKSVNMQDGLVLNSTEEIRAMLEKGEYMTDRTVYHVIRKQAETGQQGN